MYTAKDEYYKALYEKPVVKSYVTGTIFHDAGAISISDQNIVKGSLSINNRCVNGSGFEYGAVYQGEMNITLMIDAGRYSLYDKKISLTAHYVLDNETVSIPLGQWKISTPERSKKLLTIKALDAMSDFSEIIPEAFTGTAYEMLTAACTACGVPLGMTQAEVETLTNGKVSYYANTEYFDTYRDLLSYLGKCTCTFATIDRNGALLLREYGTEPVRSIPATRRSDTVVTDYETYHKGVRMRFLAEENFFPYEKGCGEDGITMDLGDIPIVNGTPEAKQAVCDAICAKLSSVRYTPAHFVQLVGDPTLELGDMITVDGQKTYVMSYTWNHHGSMRIQGVGDDAKHPKFKNKNLVDVPTLNDTLADAGVDQEEVEDIVQQAMQEATALINGAEGGYFTIMTDNVVVDGVTKEVPIGWRVMNTPSLTENTKLWQMSMGGFAFSADGGRTFTNVAIDMNGNIVANKMTTGTLDCTNINVSGLEVGKNVIMGENAVITWDNLPDNVASSAEVPSYSEITYITKNTIATESLTAKNLTINGGKVAIDGDEEFSYILLDDGTVSTELYSRGLIISGAGKSTQITQNAVSSDYINGDTIAEGGEFLSNKYASLGHSHFEYYGSGDIMVCQSIRPNTDGQKACGSSTYRWSNVYCENAEINTSDRKLKENIEPVNDKYIAMFDKLSPVSYKLVSGDRTHIGFVSQDVEEKMAEVGLTDMDFGGFCKDVITDEEGNEVERYGLRYSEFIGIMAAKIKQLEERIERLEGQANKTE